MKKEGWEWWQECTDILEKDHDKYVPLRGATETVYGEIVRAIARLVYRYFNDGERFSEGYGIETCGGAYMYLKQIDPTFERILNDMKPFEPADNYDKGLVRLCQHAVTLRDKKDSIENSDDFLNYSAVSEFGDPNEDWGDDDEDED
jgi:hypothetical protein